MNYKYLLDANVLSTSKVRGIIDTDFFKSNCVVLDEIAYELIDTSIGKTLRAIAEPPELGALDRLREVVDDLVELSILQTDRGNGDALLIAAALFMRDGAEGQEKFPFMRDHPVVVTDEKLVDAYAKKKGIDAISGMEFMKIFLATKTAM